MRKLDADIRRRCHTELERVFGNPIDCAHTCGFTNRQTLDWFDGFALPSHVSLRVLDQFGVDIYYIITGKRVVNTDV